MTLSRRSFLTACIATCTAPMIVRASSLMPVSTRPWNWLDLPEPMLAESNLEKIWIEMNPIGRDINYDSKLLWPGVRKFYEQAYNDYLLSADGESLSVIKHP